MIPRANLSYPDYLDWKRLNHVFNSMDVYEGTPAISFARLRAETVRGIESAMDSFGR